MEYTRFYYDSYSDKKKQNIRVEIYGDQQIPGDEYVKMYDEFDEYLNNLKTDDIVEIVSNIRKILHGIVEDEFMVTMTTEQKHVFVKYVQGKLDCYNFKLDDWDDVIYIEDNYRGLNVQLKKSQAGFYNEESTKKILADIMKYAETVYKLREIKIEKGRQKIK